MTKKDVDQPINRRNFLKAAAITAAAATATGAGAAFINQKPGSAAVATPALPSFSAPAAVTTNTTTNHVTELWTRLTESQAENIRLQAALAAAERRITTLEQQMVGEGGAAEALTVELATANQQVSVLSGLIALYEQLDEVDLTSALHEGMTAVSETITDLMDQVPTLDEGIAIGRQALQELEDHIPLLENGRIWLGNQMNRVQTYYQSIELLLQAAVENVGPLLEMLSEWFQKILKWLPFNMGQQAVEIMQSMTNFLAETPPTLTGLNTQVAQPLDVWVKREAETETPLHKNLLKPLREQVLDKANQTTAKARQIQTTYETQLAQPTQTAVDSQHIIRDLITQYRERHQI